MDKKIKFGIIGAGNMGTAHMRSFTAGKIENGVITAVADIKEKRLEAARETIGADCQFFGSGKDLIDNAGVDAVIIATPHYSHPELSAMALQKGLNVICEKPAGVYTKQVIEMNSAAGKSGRLFTIMFNQRTNPLYQKMREYIAGGRIGAIKRLSWIITTWYRSQSYYDSGSWRATWAGEGGGVLFNQCPHQLDLLQWITGMMPRRVRAFCHFGKWHDIEVEDDVTAYLEYPGGATGTFITSTADTPGTNRFEILGTKGKLVCENNRLKMYQLKTDEREFNNSYKGGFGEPEAVFTEITVDGEGTQHAGIINNFANALLGKEKLFVDGTEGLKSVQLMNSMLLSTWLNDFVELPFDDELYLAELNKRIANSKIKQADSAGIMDLSKTY